MIASGIVSVLCKQNHRNKILFPMIIVEQKSLYKCFLYSNKTNPLDQSAWPLDNPVPVWDKKSVPITCFHGT